MWPVRNSRAPVLLMGVLLLAVGCERGTPAVESPDNRLVEDVPSTEQRPYTFSLPERWSVEGTVHSDGGSFVIAPLDQQGETRGGGKVYGVVEPSGRIVPFTPASDYEQIVAMGSDGSEVSVNDAISMDGHPAWEVLFSHKSPAGLTLMAGIDVGDGAGVAVVFTVADDAYDADLLRAIVRSIRIDEAQLGLTLAEASQA